MFQLDDWPVLLSASPQIVFRSRDRNNSPTILVPMAATQAVTQAAFQSRSRDRAS